MIPENPLAFIKDCISNGRIYWTYHVNMRMKERFISRPMILEAINSFDIIESYPTDKYPPSYLVWAKTVKKVFHVLFEVDAFNDNVRVITAYSPDSTQWNESLKERL